MKTRKLLILYSVLLAAVAILIGLLINIKGVDKPALRTWQEIEESRVLKAVTEYGSLGYYISGDSLQGFEYELSRKLSEISGLEIQLTLEMNLDKSFAMLKDGEVDVLMRNIPITDALKDEFDFTIPILASKQVLVQRTIDLDSNKINVIRNQIELGGQTLYVPEHSPAIQRIKNLSEEIGDTIYINENKLYSSEQLFLMVVGGDIDYAVCDQRIAQDLQTKYPNIDINTDISFNQLQGWAVRKDSHVLLDSLNSWIKQLDANDEIQSLIKKYYR
ncbi:MAG: transporter substrate-binding domain-containing protein [Tannerellaceae bacterium]